MRFNFTEYQLLGMDLDNPGGCTACGSEAYGCEPDLRKGTCESCGAKAVYGAEELLMMGLVDVV